MNYVYIICMKNGKEYKTEIKMPIDELIVKLMPNDKYEIKIFHCNIFDKKGSGVAIIGNEVSSVEYFYK